VERDNLYSAFYKLTDSRSQITSYVFDVGKQHCPSSCWSFRLSPHCCSVHEALHLAPGKGHALGAERCVCCTAAVRATVPKILLDDVFTVRLLPSKQHPTPTKAAMPCMQRAEM
jgi:hypothetical protein